MTRLPIDEACSHLGEIGDRVAADRDRVIVERDGKSLFALISLEDLTLLEQLEDRYWSEEGGKALDAFDTSGQRGVGLEEVRKDLGL